ncbi:MAG: hypothetical protein NTV82_05740 [Candidatus Aminicenantes bacterium]|jgi:hypothetical protein|nr:hypothetical protein [Candidatus Aminicenantes bacterium]
MKTLWTKKHILMGLALLAASIFLPACNPLENDSRSNSILVVENITGKDMSGTDAGFLQSDVVKKDNSIAADTAKATLSARFMDPAPILGTSQYSDIMVTRYVVSFSRTDGRNRPGADVPFPFEGSLSTLVRVDSTASVNFVIVREAAKLEAPLVNLRDSAYGDILNMTAKIEFYGHDLTDKAVKGTGYLTVYFANYVDK